MLSLRPFGPHRPPPSPRPIKTSPDWACWSIGRHQTDYTVNNSLVQVLQAGQWVRVRSRDVQVRRVHSHRHPYWRIHGRPLMLPAFGVWRPPSSD